MKSSSPAAATPTLADAHRARRWAWLIIGLFLLGGLAYSLIVPPFETPDEPFHYGFARHIAQGNGLPVQDPENTGPWAQEGSQAPLYYLLTGWATTFIDQSDFPALAVRNPRANIGDPLYPGNKNFMLYAGRWQPLQGANLALHVGRWLSLLLGALTLWATWRLAQYTFPRRQTLPLLAMALVAAIPQFLFLSASFSNDNAVIAASAFTLFWLARLLAKADDAPVTWWEWGVLGVALGAAALSKLQGLGLIPLSGLVVLWLAWRRHTWRILLDAVLFAGIPAMAIAGWWYWRNIVLYGDWSGLSHLMEINGRREGGIDWRDFWPEFAGLRFSAWGVFGWFNILLPEWFYRVMDAVTVIGLVGAGLATGRMVTRHSSGVIRHQSSDAPHSPAPRYPSPLAPRIVLMLWIWLAMMLALLLYWTAQATGSQGRLLFPALSAFAVLLTAGIDFWLRWLPRPARGAVWAGLLVLLVGMSLYTLGWLLPGAYFAPAPVAAIPASAQPVDLRYGDGQAIRLAAVEIAPERVRAGDTLPVTLYFQAPEKLDHDYQLFVQLLDEKGMEIANLTTHPGWGRNPTTFWEADATYADTYQLPVTGEVANWSPLAARLYVGFIDPATEGAPGQRGTFLPLPAYDAAGAEITPFVGSVVVTPHTPPVLDGVNALTAGSEFGGVIRLDRVETEFLQETQFVTTTLLWEATGTPATDYTAFVHVLDAAGQRVAGFDQAPAGARLPTARWRAGDRVLSEFEIALESPLPPGTYTLWAGLYESASAGALRLPVTAPGALVAGDGQVRVGEFEIQPQ
jgi:4-amino-4-deoxy-L-arabinose transferase-like glycosyltransferase